ncbi:alpha/beta hydrolase [Actinocrispum wychmicini]|uniref:Alpha/beta hydrolase family protein n=1 Tax=Actinocrispum wychmicini TaxID=1213861 RepID=A0A4V2S8R0_9PSEU|nr:alpha/beta hydrolase [Actinocrispum wychmicini]TCO64600.1 alpha/beta hydrolase family protein [Actinocrispum wychmicini]
MRRRPMVLATLLLLGITATTTTATAAPAPGVGWQPCAPTTTVECGTVTVPIDYARPSTGTIDVAVARARATGRKQGTLVFMPGGPGDSGVETLVDGNVVPPAVAERFDVVSFDPRGTNRSHPIMCDLALLANLPNFVPEAGARLSVVQNYARDLGTSCRQLTGPLVDHVDSVSVARDIDTIRAALGEQQITLYGRSYGTLTGQMYAENFPWRVRGLVLDSVFDHSLTPSKFVTDAAGFGEDSFNEFEKWCAADTTCALHGQDPGQVYGDLWAKAIRGDLPVTPMNLASTVVNYFYKPNWAGAANRLKALSEVRSTKAAPEAVPFPQIATCADQRVRISSQHEWEAWWRKQNAAAPTVRTHFAFALFSLCSAWPAATPNPQHRTTIGGVPPVLIMNASHDPATGLEWARSVNRQLRGSVLLTYDGWGHGVVDRTDCTRAVFTNYVLAGTTPWPGTHCPAGTV